MAAVINLKTAHDLPPDRDWVLVERSNQNQFHIWTTAEAGHEDSSQIRGPVGDLVSALTIAQELAVQRGITEIFLLGDIDAYLLLAVWPQKDAETAAAISPTSETHFRQRKRGESGVQNAGIVIEAAVPLVTVSPNTFAGPVVWAVAQNAFQLNNREHRKLSIY